VDVVHFGSFFTGDTLFDYFDPGDGSVFVNLLLLG
jgi:hypothetical protein